MPPIALAALALAYSGLEYWLGKTEKVKANSSLSLALTAGRFIIGSLIGRKR